MPAYLLPVPHIPQRDRADCLAACAAMLLAYSGHSLSYSRLLSLLGVTSYGTPGRNLTRLSEIGVSVEYSEGSMAALREMIASKTPLIALVRTSDLPHWPIATNHAVVVTGYETGEILMNDPSFADHPLKVSAEAFELAWMAFDYRYAVISSQD